MCVTLTLRAKVTLHSAYCCLPCYSVAKCSFPCAATPSITLTAVPVPMPTLTLTLTLMLLTPTRSHPCVHTCAHTTRHVVADGNGPTRVVAPTRARLRSQPPSRVPDQGESRRRARHPVCKNTIPLSFNAQKLRLVSCLLAQLQPLLKCPCFLRRSCAEGRVLRLEDAH